VGKGWACAIAGLLKANCVGTEELGGNGRLKKQRTGSLTVLERQPAHLCLFILHEHPTQWEVESRDDDIPCYSNRLHTPLLC